MYIRSGIINSNPRLTKWLIKSGVFYNCPLNVIDVGVRRGFEKHWDFYKNQANLIGFEPEANEYHRLINKEKAENKQYYPYALDVKKSVKKMKIVRQIASSGFYKSDKRFMKRFPDFINSILKKELLVKTTSLDLFLKEKKIKSVDFIKIDTEGNELKVLTGARKALTDSTLGVSLEVAFYPINIDQPLFGDIALFLRDKGFEMYDIKFFRLARKALSPYAKAKRPGLTHYGQIVQGQALYLRDAVKEIQYGEVHKWNAQRVLKLVSLLELFNLPDCAIELVQVAGQEKILRDFDLDKLIKLLVPLVNGQAVSLSQYQNYLEKKYIEKGWLTPNKINKNHKKTS